MAVSTSGISPSFLGLSRSSGQVTHVLLTRSRLCPRPKPGSSLHLHVLSTPPAFVLSQDQTLREELLAGSRRGRPSQRVVMSSSGAPYTQRHPDHDRVTSKLTNSGRTRSTEESLAGAHAVEFSKTAAPLGEGGAFRGHARALGHAAGRTGQYSAALRWGKAPSRPRRTTARGHSTGPSAEASRRRRRSTSRRRPVKSSQPW